MLVIAEHCSYPVKDFSASDTALPVSSLPWQKLIRWPQPTEGVPVHMASAVAGVAAAAAWGLFGRGLAGGQKLPCASITNASLTHLFLLFFPLLCAVVWWFFQWLVVLFLYLLLKCPYLS